MTPLSEVLPDLRQPHDPYLKEAADDFRNAAAHIRDALGSSNPRVREVNLRLADACAEEGRKAIANALKQVRA